MTRTKLTHEEVVVIQIIKSGLQQQAPVVARLMTNCNLTTWEAWRIVNRMKRRGLITEEGMSKKDRLGRTIGVKTFTLTKYGESLLSPSTPS